MSERELAFSQLETVFGPRFSTDEHQCLRYFASTNRTYSHPPIGVVRPRSTSEVVSLVDIASVANLPLVAYGAGYSRAGQAAAVRNAIMVDFAQMDRILRLRAEDMDVTLQPGLRCEALNHRLDAVGLHFPFDPGVNATLGGMVSSRTPSLYHSRYGSMRDNVISMEVVLADGRVVRTSQRSPVYAGGYDLNAVFVGAEGTLGLITELTLRLHAAPQAFHVARCGFANIRDAARTAFEAVHAGLCLARLEFLDRETVRCLNAYADAGFQNMPHIFVELQGSAVSVADDARAFAEIVADNDGLPVRWSSFAEERDALWAIYNSASFAISANDPQRQTSVVDVNVPLSRVVDVLLDTEATLLGATLPGYVMGSLGQGNVQMVLMCDVDRETEIREKEELSRKLIERARASEGDVGSPIPDGMYHSDLAGRMFGPASQLMQDIKDSWDPNNLMNPGKLLPMTTE